MDPVEQIMRMFEAHFEAEMGWDQRPLYFMLFRNGDGIGANTLSLPGPMYSDPSTGIPMLAHFIHQDDEHAENSFHGFLGAMAKTSIKAQLPPIEFHFYGIGALHEGWSVYSLTEDDAQAIEDGTALPPSQHPDRVEVRMVHVVTTDGRFMSLTRQRGGTPELLEAEPSIDENGEPTIGPMAVGRMPTALRLLCDGVERLASA
jgi:hypothetical protein